MPAVQAGRHPDDQDQGPLRDSPAGGLFRGAERAPARARRRATAARCASRRASSSEQAHFAGFEGDPATSTPTEDTLLPQTVKKLGGLGVSPREVALDGGFNIGPSAEALGPRPQQGSWALAMSGSAAPRFKRRSVIGRAFWVYEVR